MSGRWCPRTLTVATGVNHEMHRGDGRTQVRAEPLIAAAPGAEIVWIDSAHAREVLAGAPIIVAEPPAALFGIVGKCDALRDPGAELILVARQVEVGDVQKEPPHIQYAAL